jgi:hypothetical protein
MDHLHEYAENALEQKLVLAAGLPMIQSGEEPKKHPCYYLK